MKREPKHTLRKNPGDEKEISETVRKWGQDLVEAGYTLFPSTLIKYHRDLGLDTVDLAIVLLLASHWWTAEALPFLLKQTIADVVGIDASNVRKRLQRLEQKGLLKRTMRKVNKDRNKSSLYDLTPLVIKARPFALKEIESKNAAIAARAAKPSVPPLKAEKQIHLKVVPKS